MLPLDVLKSDFKVAERLKTTPVLMLNGNQDGILPYKLVETSAEFFKRNGFWGHLERVYGQGHEICNEYMDKFGFFLAD
jgi:predicted esterase